MGTQMLAVTDVIELHYTTITPELLLDRTALNTIDSSSPGQELFNHIIFKKLTLNGCFIEIYSIQPIPVCEVILESDARMNE